MPKEQGPVLPGRYIREALIAASGHGTVHKGRDTLTGETIVIKELKADLVAQHLNLISRFRREGEALRQLNHPNIVKMIAVEDEGETPSLIMEYVPGGSLADRLKREAKLPVDRVLDIALELADALTRTQQLLEEARSEFNEMGATGWVALVNEKLASLD